ncbi:MAG TPA: hypothetical protein VFF81_13145 [Noviherbaspirillum sp.]|nr:hypothetical protein [Noviherbaspirillum sp.]
MRRLELKSSLKAVLAAYLWRVGKHGTRSVLKYSSLLWFAGISAVLPAVPAHAMKPEVESGIRFSCTPVQLSTLDAEVDAYLAHLGIAGSLVVKRIDHANGVAVYSLNTPKHDFNTLDFKDRPEFGVGTEVVSLPSGVGQERKLETVSQKEIVLALMQNGRLTEFGKKGCDINALKEHVAVRQNIVAWAEILEFGWPDGGSAKWNNACWDWGTPVAGQPLQAILNDVFLNQDKYSIGCYAAARLVAMQGVFDFYARVVKDPVKQKIVQDRLMADGEPLIGVEPGKIWAFETDAGPEQVNRPGKILKIQQGVAPKNFVPGDWTYFLNTDPATYQKTGYEGSNAIYLGRNRFSDYYNDHDHSYTYEEKLDEVYQWRNGVFSRSRDADKIKPLQAQDFDRLSRTPEEGGLVLDSRLFPYFFGYEDLP